MVEYVEYKTQEGWLVWPRLNESDPRFVVAWVLADRVLYEAGKKWEAQVLEGYWGLARGEGQPFSREFIERCNKELKNEFSFACVASTAASAFDVATHHSRLLIEGVTNGMQAITKEKYEHLYRDLPVRPTGIET